MKSIFSRVFSGSAGEQKSDGAISRDQKEDSLATLEKQNLLVLANVLALSGTNDKCFHDACTGIRDVMKTARNTSKFLIMATHPQVSTFLNAACFRVSKTLSVGGETLLEPSVMTTRLTTSIELGGLKDLFPILTFLVQAENEAELISRPAPSAPLIAILIQLLNTQLDETPELQQMMDTITEFICAITKFRVTIDQLTDEWAILNSMSCLDVLFSVMGAVVRPVNQIRCLQILLAAFTAMVLVE